MIIPDKTIGAHMDLRTLSANLDEIGAKRVVLTHMSDDMLGRLGGLAFEAAEDGKTISL